MGKHIGETHGENTWGNQMGKTHGKTHGENTWKKHKGEQMIFKGGTKCENRTKIELGR